MAKKPIEDIKALKDTIQQQQDYIQELQGQLKGNDTVSRAEYDGILRQFEAEQQQKEQYKLLYEKAKAKDLKLLETEKKLNVVHISKYKELEENNERQVEEIRASHKKIADLEKDIRKLRSEKSPVILSGRKRKNDISDIEVARMSQEGKSLRTISKETGLSINTIRDILKSVSK